MKLLFFIQIFVVILAVVNVVFAFSVEVVLFTQIFSVFVAIISFIVLIRIIRVLVK